jgi:general secretion pathway protein B
MSYILDALRKSETERRQGRVPDLGQQVQLIHRPRRKRVSPALWISLALLVNAGVLGYVFWPGFPPEEPMAVQTETAPETAPPPLDAVTTAPEPATAVRSPAPDKPVAGTGNPVDAPARPPATDPVAAPVPRERATIIVPSAGSSGNSPSQSAPEQAGRVPHLVELPLSFQKSVPDLTFNSHIYSSSPSSRRVMINNAYLRIGESVAGLRVEDITEEGVVLSRNGQRFRVGVVRNWVSPR